IVAPCIWAGPCPALAHGRDWCHDAATTTVGPWEGPTPPATGSRGETPRSPTRFAQRGSRVDFSYLVLREAKRGSVSNQLAGDDLLYGIVSDPLHEKGRLKLYACGPSGRHQFIRLERNESPANAAFGNLVRGDVARFTGLAAGTDGARIEATTTVEKV